MSKQNSPLVLGTEHISKLLTQYAIPAIIAMTASSLYNMADSIFIGHGVGPLAISGLALTFPLMNLAAAFGSLVGVGASTLVSVKLGQKDYEGANKVLGNVLVLNVVLGLAFTLVFMLLLDPILYFFGASENTISYARDYMNVILMGNVITHMYLGLNAVLRSSGFPELAMYATLSGDQLCAESALYLRLRLGNQRIGMGYRHLSGHFVGRTVDPFFPPEGVVAFQERHLQAEKRDREGDSLYRDVAFPDESLRLPDRDPDQSGAERTRGRYGDWGIRDRESGGIPLYHDYHGIQPRNATDCRL